MLGNPADLRGAEQCHAREAFSEGVIVACVKQWMCRRQDVTAYISKVTSPRVSVRSCARGSYYSQRCLRDDVSENVLTVIVRHFSSLRPCKSSYVIVLAISNLRPYLSSSCAVSGVTIR